MDKKENLIENLKKYFGYDSFREGQEEIISHILQGDDVLGVLPTGGGKSICYQLPALMMGGVCLVISPLISLMKDQVDSLLENGIPASFINSSMTKKEYTEALSSIASGKTKIVYVSPERLENQFFIDFIKSINISFVAVDEAHCISKWGHDFRPSYKLIPELYQILGDDLQITAFTATATKEVREDIVENLKLVNPFVKVTGFDRENLLFEVRKPKDKFAFLKSYLKDHKDQAGIIYASTRKTVEAIYRYLKKEKFSVTYYHAGLADSEKKVNQEDFIFDRKNIIVATNAFGMGIDKSDVRFVIHYNMPQDMESYYQEAGRGGRDGEKSDAILLYSGQDIVINKFLIRQTNNFEQERNKLKNLQIIINYVNTSECLRKYILNYFGQEAEDSCKACSNCLSEFKKIDVTVDSQKILSCIYRLDQRYGVSTVVACLKGSKSADAKRKNLESVSTYGIMKNESQKYIKDLVEALIADGYISVRGLEYPILKLTEKSKEVLFGEKKVYIKEIQRDEKLIKKEKSSDIYDRDDYDQALFSRLKKLRLELSKRRNVPPFIIFSDASLKDMSIKKPKSEEDFLEVKGVGNKKLIQYGDLFLAEIKEFMAEKRAKDNIYYEELE